MDYEKALLTQYGNEPHRLENFKLELPDVTLTLRYFKISKEWFDAENSDKTQYWPEPFFRLTTNSPPGIMIFQDIKHISEYSSILRNRASDLESRLKKWRDDQVRYAQLISKTEKELAAIDEKIRQEQAQFIPSDDPVRNRHKQELEKNLIEYRAALSAPQPSLNDGAGWVYWRQMMLNKGPTISIKKMIEIYEQNKRWWLDGFGTLPKKRWKHSVKEGEVANGIVVVIDYKG